MLTASRIIADAKQIARVRGYDTQALDQINAILSDLCQTTDLALARGLFTFNFNPGLTSLFGSGPYNLPLDFLRTSGTSGAEGVTRAAWYLYPAPAFPAGQTMPLVPIDLGEFDMYPQLPAQGLPSTIATDMGGPLTQRLILTTPTQLTAGSTTASPEIVLGLVAGLGVAGEGISPGTMLTAVTPFTLITSGDTDATTSITGIVGSDWAQITVGDAVSGGDIPIGAIVAALPVSGEVTLSVPAAGTNPGEVLAFSHTHVTLSRAATASLAAASVFYGIPPVCYIYPPPVGPYPCSIRYQRMMPPLIDLSQYPWFPQDGYMIDELAARLMPFSGNPREAMRHAAAQEKLHRYLGLSDDKTNRAQAVQLDARLYGAGANYARLKNTKVAGW